MIKMRNSLFLILALILTLTGNCLAEEKPQKYMPYPIIFVGGVGTIEEANTDYHSPSHWWPEQTLYKEFLKYFVVGPSNLIPKYDYQEPTSNELKLKLSEKPHLEFLFYNAREAPVDINARILKEEIEKILNKKGGYYDEDNFTYTEPCATPKIIIVAHSYGGIITRYMLVHNIGNIRDKVAAVFFLGVPQSGSPLSTIGYFLPKEIPYLAEGIKDIDKTLKDLPHTLDNYCDRECLILIQKQEREKIAGNLRYIRWAESEKGFFNTSLRNTKDNHDIKEAIKGDTKLEKLYKSIPEPSDNGAVYATIINDIDANSYRKKFEARRGIAIQKIVRDIPRDKNLSYDLSDSVLSSLGTNIGVDNVHAIAGTEYFWLRQFLGEIMAFKIGSSFNHNDYTCVNKGFLNNGEGFWNDGDGVVNLQSQKLIGEKHEIYASHGTIFPFTKGEPDYSGNPPSIPATADIILQAIDDPPVIESVRFVLTGEKDENYPSFSTYPQYVVFKVKDYLLADIEISEMTLSGIENIADFYDPVTSTYRPYFKFEKDFLREREDKTAPIIDSQGNVSYLHLQPGEFYLKARDFVRAGRLKIKNPARKETACEIMYLNWADRRAIIREGEVWRTEVDNNSFTYASAREQAYNNFLNDEGTLYVGYSTALHIGLSGAGFHRHWTSVDDSGIEHDVQQIRAYMNFSYGDCKFTINIDNNKRIKSAFVFSRIFKESLDSASPTPVPEANILVYRAASDVWPPAFDVSNDSLMFRLNAVDNINGGIFTLELGPQDIHPGINIWKGRSDFQLYNYIPADAPSAGEGELRSITIAPTLIIVLEDKEQEELKR